ncbi:MAG: signal recognition particle protein [Actinomycetota bacterium]
MFESLTDRFEGIFTRLRGKGVLSEADVEEVLREIRVALLEADVNLTVVRNLRNRIRERAVGEEVHQALNPAQQVVKIVNEELTASLGGETIDIRYASKPPTVVLMAGLQGSGKTTSSAKLARWFKSQGRNPLLVGADLQRPAAVDQLRTLGGQIDVPVYSDPSDPVRVAAGAIEEARSSGRDIVIVDTAGRLAIDAELMEEVRQISEVTSPDYTFLVVDAMTGQDAVNVAEAFHDKLELDGVILTKLDGDARGGAALSVKEVVGRPIAFAATGEKLEDFDLFHPDRMANRILGMGDMLTLIEKAEQTFEAEEAEEAAARLLEGQFTLDDFLEQMQQLKKMGPLNNLVGMLPGMPKEVRDVEIGDKEVGRIEAIIKSMTPAERTDPSIIDTSRRTRIANGSGTNPTQVAGLLTQFSEMQKMMKRFGGMGTKKAKRNKRKDNKKGRKGKKGGGRVTAKGGGRVTQKGGGRVTPKGEKATKSPLTLPGLDRIDDLDFEQMADELGRFDHK